MMHSKRKTDPILNKFIGSDLNCVSVALKSDTPEKTFVHKII